MLLRCSGQLRIVAGVVVGFDLAGAIALARALAHELMPLAELLPAGEAGLLAATRRQAPTGDHP